MKEYRIKISRYNPEVDERPIFVEYKVPYVEQDSVLGALLYIYEEIDSTLLFSYGCRYRICGKCAIKINGDPGLACETPLEDGMILEPLDHLPLIRDLAVDRSSFIEPLRRHGITLSKAEKKGSVLQPPEFLNLMRCNECLSCLSNCPVFRQKVGYEGPFFGAKLAYLHYDEREERKLLGRLEAYLDQCIQCKRCEVSCPWDVHFAEVSTKIKGELFKNKRIPLRDWLIARPALLGSVASLLASPLNSLMKNGIVRKLLDRLVKIDERAPLPDYRRVKSVGKGEQKQSSATKVAYFLGCFEKYNAPSVAEDSLSLLEASGATVNVLDLGCCGIPFIGLGDLEAGRKRASAIAKGLEKWILDGYDIVASCSSCASAIKKEYPSLYHVLKEESVQNHIFELGDYLWNMYQSRRFEVAFKQKRERIGYHVSCHLKALKRGMPYLHLLKLIPGLEIGAVFDKCCGMAGTMGFKKERYELSQKVGEPLIDEVKESHLKLVLTECASCAMKIRKDAEVETLHPVSFLAQAMEGD